MTGVQCHEGDGVWPPPDMVHLDRLEALAETWSILNRAREKGCRYPVVLSYLTLVGSGYKLKDIMRISDDLSTHQNLVILSTALDLFAEDVGEDSPWHEDLTIDANRVRVLARAFRE